MSASKSKCDYWRESFSIYNYLTFRRFITTEYTYTPIRRRTKINNGETDKSYLFEDISWRIRIESTTPRGCRREILYWYNSYAYKYHSYIALFCLINKNIHMFVSQVSRGTNRLRFQHILATNFDKNQKKNMRSTDVNSDHSNNNTKDELKQIIYLLHMLRIYIHITLVILLLLLYCCCYPWK